MSGTGRAGGRRSWLSERAAQCWQAIPSQRLLPPLTSLKPPSYSSTMSVERGRGAEAHGSSEGSAGRQSERRRTAPLSPAPSPSALCPRLTVLLDVLRAFKIHHIAHARAAATLHSEAQQQLLAAALRSHFAEVGERSVGERNGRRRLLGGGLACLGGAGRVGGVMRSLCTPASRQQPGRTGLGGPQERRDGVSGSRLPQGHALSGTACARRRRVLKGR